MAAIKPIHQHDCERCTHLGVLTVKGGGQADLYRSCNYGSGIGASEFILRFSSEGSDYATTDNVGRYL